MRDTYNAFAVVKRTPKIGINTARMETLIIRGTVSERTDKSIALFMQLDGMGKYLESGWKQAQKDGYALDTVSITLD